MEPRANVKAYVTPADGSAAVLSASDFYLLGRGGHALEPRGKFAPSDVALQHDAPVFAETRVARDDSGDLVCLQKLITTEHWPIHDAAAKCMPLFHAGARIEPAVDRASMREEFVASHIYRIPPCVLTSSQRTLAATSLEKVFCENPLVNTFVTATVAGAGVTFAPTWLRNAIDLQLFRLYNRASPGAQRTSLATVCVEDTSASTSRTMGAVNAANSEDEDDDDNEDDNADARRATLTHWTDAGYYYDCAAQSTATQVIETFGRAQTPFHYSTLDTALAAMPATRVASLHGTGAGLAVQEYTFTEPHDASCSAHATSILSAVHARRSQQAESDPLVAKAPAQAAHQPGSLRTEKIALQRIVCTGHNQEWRALLDRLLEQRKFSDELVANWLVAMFWFVVQLCAIRDAQSSTTPVLCSKDHKFLELLLGKTFLAKCGTSEEFLERLFWFDVRHNYVGGFALLLLPVETSQMLHIANPTPVGKEPRMLNAPLVVALNDLLPRGVCLGTLPDVRTHATYRVVSKTALLSRRIVYGVAGYVVQSTAACAYLLPVTAAIDYVDRAHLNRMIVTLHNKTDDGKMTSNTAMERFLTFPRRADDGTALGRAMLAVESRVLDGDARKLSGFDEKQIALAYTASKADDAVTINQFATQLAVFANRIAQEKEAKEAKEAKEEQEKQEEREKTEQQRKQVEQEKQEKEEQTDIVAKMVAEVAERVAAAIAEEKQAAKEETMTTVVAVAEEATVAAPVAQTAEAPVKPKKGKKRGSRKKNKTVSNASATTVTDATVAEDDLYTFAGSTDGLDLVSVTSAHTVAEQCIDGVDDDWSASSGTESPAVAEFALVASSSATTSSVVTTIVNPGDVEGDAEKDNGEGEEKEEKAEVVKCDNGDDNGDEVATHPAAENIAPPLLAGNTSGEPLLTTMVMPQFYQLPVNMYVQLTNMSQFLETLSVPLQYARYWLHLASCNRRFQHVGHVPIEYRMRFPHELERHLTMHAPGAYTLHTPFGIMLVACDDMLSRRGPRGEISPVVIGINSRESFAPLERLGKRIVEELARVAQYGDYSGNDGGCVVCRQRFATRYWFAPQHVDVAYNVVCRVLAVCDFDGCERETLQRLAAGTLPGIRVVLRVNGSIIICESDQDAYKHVLGAHDDSFDTLGDYAEPPVFAYDANGRPYAMPRRLAAQAHNLACNLLAR
jgi:hypothetical protein